MDEAISYSVFEIDFPAFEMNLFVQHLLNAHIFEEFIEAFPILYRIITIIKDLSATYLSVSCESKSSQIVSPGAQYVLTYD